jgi:aspartate aminotransferase-like enzyme
MNDDYFAKLDEQLSALTAEGAHLDRWARWRPLDRAARRTVAALGLVMLLATLLVIEFPGSASGCVHRATAHKAQTVQMTLAALIPQSSVSDRPAAAPIAARGRLA